MRSTGWSRSRPADPAGTGGSGLEAREAQDPGLGTSAGTEAEDVACGRPRPRVCYTRRRVILATTMRVGSGQRMNSVVTPSGSITFS